MHRGVNCKTVAELVRVRVIPRILTNSATITAYELLPSCTIGLVHILNPHGMAWLRRFNESNVDLNRNFLIPGEDYKGAPPGYKLLDSFLNPPSRPPWDFFYLRAGWLMVRYGMPTLKQVVAGGQYEYPKGLFFGGKQLEEGPQKYQTYVAEYLATVERLVVIDVHTGLGLFGEGYLVG